MATRFDEAAPPFAPSQRARMFDTAGMLCLYAGLLMMLPARLVVAGIGFDLTPAMVVGFVLGLWWFCAQLCNGLGVAKGRNAVRFGMLTFIGANIATYAYATWGYLPGDELRAADRSTIMIIGVAMVGILAADGLRSLDAVDRVLLAVLNLGAVVAAFGLLQFFVGLDLPVYFEKIPGLRTTFALTGVLDRAVFRRPAGTAGHPIEFGVVMACLLPIAAHYAFRAQQRGGRRLASRRGTAYLRWRWTVVLLLAVGSFVSVSRSAIVGLMAGALVLVPTWSPRRRIRVAMVSFAFVCVLRLLVPGLVGTLVSLFRNFGNDDSIAGRTEDYANVSGTIRDHLLLGRGFGTYLPGRYGPLDNQYLGSLVETGLIGMLSLLAAMFAAVVAVRRVRRATTDETVRDLCQCLAAAVVILIVAYATFDAFAFAIVTGLTFLLLGCCGALLRVYGRPVA